MKQEVLLLIIIFLGCGGYALNCIYTNGIDSNHQMKKINCPANESSCMYAVYTSFSGGCMNITRQTSCIQDNFSTVCFCNSNYCNDVTKFITNTTSTSSTSTTTNSSLDSVLCYQYSSAATKRLVHCNGSCMKNTTKGFKKGCIDKSSDLGCKIVRHVMDPHTIWKQCYCSTD